jgi:hypothetical protein
MGVKRRKGRSDQRSLFEGLEADLRHDTTGEGRTGPGVPEEPQASTALDPGRALTDRRYKQVRNRRIRKYVRWCGRTAGQTRLLPDSLLALLANGSTHQRGFIGL